MTQPVDPSMLASYPEPLTSSQNMSMNAPPGSVTFAGDQAGGAAQAPPVNLAQLVGPTRAVPAQWVPTSRQTQMQSGVQYSPETYAALQKMTQATNAQDQASADALAAQQAEDQKKARAEASQADADMAEYQSRKQAQDVARTQAFGKVQEATQDLQNAEQQGVDPSHWWHSKDTGSKIAMAIGAIASGWAQGTGHGGNQMWDTINKSIDRDVESQKENLAGKSRSLQNAMGLYSLMRQKGMDEDSAADAAKLLAHQQLEANLKAQLTETPNALGKIALQKTIVDNQERLLKLRSAIEERAADRTSISGGESFRQAQTVGGAANVLAEASRIYNSKYGQPGNSWDAAMRAAIRGKTGVDVAPGMAEPVIGAAKGGAGAARALAKPAMAAQAHLSDLAQLEKLAGNAIAGPQTQAQYDALASKLRAEGVPVPDKSTILDRVSGGTQGAIRALIASEKAKLAAAQNVAANGVGGQAVGGGGEETPAGFEGDEEGEGD